MGKSNYIFLIILLPACQFRRQEKKVEKSVTPKASVMPEKESKSDYTKDKGLRGWVERERSFNRALDQFSKGREFNERNLYDLLSLIELEIKSIDYMITGPRWHFKQIMNKKHDLLKNVVPAVKKIYNSCIAMAELETSDFEQTKDDYYLKSVRTSLKRSYAKVRVLEPNRQQMFEQDEELQDEVLGEGIGDSLKKNRKSNDEVGQLKQELRELKRSVVNQRSSFGNQPTIIQIPAPLMQSVTGSSAQNEKESLGHIKKQVKKLEKIANRLEIYQDITKREIPKTTQEQKEYAKELIDRLKKKNSTEIVD